jgi:hypothetical protein
VASALDQSASAEISFVQHALDYSLNASLDCSLNGSFSEVRQSKPKPVVAATQVDKARRDAEKKAAEVESASALRLDSEAKHKAARERRLQLEEENRRKLEEAEKAKREREAAKQAAVKTQLDEEQRRKREDEEKRRREKESAAAVLEEAKRKEQARAFQKVPAALLASSTASSIVESSMQRTAMFSPNKAASSLVEQTSISSLAQPTVVPATIFSPQKPAVASSLFGGVKSLISSVGGSSRAQPEQILSFENYLIFSSQASSVRNPRPALPLPLLSSALHFRFQHQFPRKKSLRWEWQLWPQQRKVDRLHTTSRTIATGLDSCGSWLLPHLTRDISISADECSDSESNASAKKPVNAFVS